MESKDSSYWSWTICSDQLHLLFKIPYDEWISIVYIFGKELHQSYDQLLNMPFFEILMILERFKEDLEKENERNKAHSENHNAQIQVMKQSMPKMQDMKLPSFQMPKIPSL